MANRRLEQLVKIIELDTSKSYLIALNKQQCTKEDAHLLLRLLEKKGHRVTIIMTDGDVRTALEALEDSRDAKAQS